MNIVGLEAIKALYIQHCGSDLMVVRAARVASNKVSTNMGKDELKLIKDLVKVKHLSPFEMCDITFLYSVPLFIARQVQRHRTGSYNEWSARYSEVKTEFYVPKTFNSRDSTLKLSEDEDTNLIGLMEYQCIKSFDGFEKLLENGVSKETARLILPQNMMTQFYMKMNLRNWMHYCALRCDTHAQYEHQVVAKSIFKQLVGMFPVSVGALAKFMFNEETLESVGIKELEVR